MKPPIYTIEDNSSPKSVRKCTDPLFLFLFGLNCTVLIIIGILGFVNGHPDRLLIPFDPNA